MQSPNKLQFPISASTSTYLCHRITMFQSLDPFHLNLIFIYVYGSKLLVAPTVQNTLFSLSFVKTVQSFRITQNHMKINNLWIVSFLTPQHIIIVHLNPKLNRPPVDIQDVEETVFCRPNE